MRIVVVSDWFSEKMGYIENCLPKAMAALGHEVHVVASNSQVYYGTPQYDAVYRDFLGPGLVACGVKELDGYVLHRLPLTTRFGQYRISGLVKALRSIRPDIVQTFTPSTPSTVEAALAGRLVGYKFFTGAHACASVFSASLQQGNAGRWERLLSWRRAALGRLVSQFTEKCYPATLDCKDIAVRFYGVPGNRTEVCPLAVDTDLFKPALDHTAMNERNSTRSKLGFKPSEIVCVYTGRFTDAKNPLCMARAVAELTSRGESIRGAFVGGGPQQEAIEALPGCLVLSFVPVWELPSVYRACDIGVWPRQESTSMLDAAACGLPIVVSDRVLAVERVKGNGKMYRENDVGDLVKCLLGLRDEGIRHQLGANGAKKISSGYSWALVAKRRLEDYEAALAKNRARRTDH